MCKQRFNYKKDNLNVYECSGFHLKNGINHIDTKRLIKLGYKDKFPEGLFSKSRNTHYFIPKYRKKYEYAVNRLLDTVNALSKDWNIEYRDAISGIKTPKQVEDETYTYYISGTVYSEDIEEGISNAILEGCKRDYKYIEIIKSIHLQYIQKMFIDYLRSIMLMLKDKGHIVGDRFDINDLRKYACEKLKTDQDENPLASLPHYKYFDLLHCINNFIKHNTTKSYQNLANSKDKYTSDEHKKFLSLHVFSEQQIGCKYESGMYAGNWLKIKNDYISNALDNLREFSKELCWLLFKEDAEEASWNYDEYLVDQLKKAFVEL